MKNIIKSFGFVFALVTTSAQAIPTLFFDGTISFDSQTEMLSVSSKLIDTYDILPAPDLEGILNFDASLISDFSGFGLVIGSFGTVAGQDDIHVFDANSNNLLTGNFSSLTMSGGAGADNGTITGMMTATDGSLMSLFGVGNLIALEFNLSSAFDAAMFSNSFDGHIDGRIQGDATNVPEPTTLALLSIGVLFIGFVNKVSRINKI